MIVDLVTDKVIGSTRYMDIAPAHFRLEIGATWLTPTHQRSRANTEAKLLLLSHAFESLDIKRVVFKTELLNEKSRMALARIGAVEEGTFRQHLFTVSGRPRDMVYFSILGSEWPGVKNPVGGEVACRTGLRSAIPTFNRSACEAQSCSQG